MATTQRSALNLKPSLGQDGFKVCICGGATSVGAVWVLLEGFRGEVCRVQGAGFAAPNP